MPNSQMICLETIDGESSNLIWELYILKLLNRF